MSTTRPSGSQNCLPDAHPPVRETVSFQPAARQPDPAADTESAPGQEKSALIHADQRSALGLGAIPGYEVLGELGRGGMGVVYKARQRSLNRLVALKMILAGSHAGPQEVNRFRSEAMAVARLQHPHIIQIYEVGEHGGRPFLSLEYCADGSLAQRLDGTPQPPREAATLVETLSRAMHAAHQRQIVHRDLKPANILLAGDGAPKITDFGLAKILDATEVMTQPGAVLGTPSYMSPEQARGEGRDLGPATDIYALGTILYELLTGRPPFKGATPVDTIVQVTTDDPVPPSRLQPSLPRDLETICLKCLEKSPSRRYPTAQALGDDLHRFLAGESIQARPAGRAERVWKWARRRPTGAALLAVSVLGLLTMLAGALYFTVQLGRERDSALALKYRAEQDEADALNELDLERRSLFTAQMWRVASLVDRDPAQARELLYDENACPQALRDFSWGYLHALCRRSEPWALSGHLGGVNAVAVSPDVKTLASAGADGTVKLWDLAARKEKAVLRGHRGPVQSLAFSPDGVLLASGGADGAIRFWKVDAATAAGAPLTGSTGAVYGLAFSPDGKRLVSASGRLDPNEKSRDDRIRDGEVRLWDVAARKQEKQLLPQEKGKVLGGFLCIDFSPDGRTVAAGNTCFWAPASVFLLDVNTGEATQFQFPSGAWIQAIRFSSDGRTLAIGTADNLVYLRDVAGGKTRLTLGGHQNEIVSLAWAPDGTTLASGDVGGRIILWDPLTGKERRTLTQDKLSIDALAYYPDGTTLAAGQRSGAVALWEVAPHSAESYPGDLGYGAVALTADGASLAAATRDKTVRLWDLASARNRTVRLGNNMGKALAYAPDGRLLAVGVQTCSDNGEKYFPTGECQLWDVHADGPLTTFKSSDQPVTAVAFLPDGRTLLTGDAGGTVRCWDVAERREAGAPLGTHPGPVLALAVSPDGRALGSAGGAEVKVWDLATRRERATLQGHAGPVTGLSFLDEGRTLASAGRDGEIHLWDVGAGVLRASFPVKQDEYLCLAVSKDGQTLALGCQDRTVKLWDVPSRQLRAVLSGHTREVNAVAFSRDGRLLVCGSAANAAGYVRSGEIKVWNADP